MKDTEGDIVWLDVRTTEGRSPESEVLEIIDDIANRLPKQTHKSLHKLWLKYIAEPPEADALATQSMNEARYFESGRTMGAEDMGCYVVNAFAYCAKVHEAWCTHRPMDAWSFAVAAARWHGAFCAMYLVACHDDEARAKMRSEVSRAAAKAKAAANPKTRAKASALTLWIERHEGKHPNLGTVEQFATEVMRRWPVLTSAKVICGWSAKWSKQVRAGEHPHL